MSHARLSPSSSARWIACPGSVREEAKYPEPPSGQAAIDGTHTHTVLEQCVNNGFMDPMLIVGTTLKDHEGEFTVDVEQAKRVTKAIGYLRKRYDHLSTVGPVRVTSECRVDAGQLLGRNDIHGTADVILETTGFVEVVDYKDGFTPVEAEYNTQMTIYAAGVLAGMDDHSPIENVRMTIIQPKMVELNREPISHWDISKDDLMKSFEDIGIAANATDNPLAELVPGDVQCKWCRAKGSCKALTTKALEEAQLMFADIDVAKEAAEKEPNEMSDEELARIIEAIPLIKQLIDGAEKEAMRRFETGHRVPGLKVIRNPGRRKWALPEEEMAEKLKRMRMPKDVIYKTTLISPKQAKEARWEMTVKGEKVESCLSERQIARLDKEYIAMTQGSLKVVPASTSGAEVIMDAESIFEDVKPAEPELPAWLQ